MPNHKTFWIFSLWGRASGPIITIVTGILASALVFLQPIWLTRYFGDAALQQIIFLIGVSGVTSILGPLGQTTGLFRVHAVNGHDGFFVTFVARCLPQVFINSLLVSGAISAISTYWFGYELNLAHAAILILTSTTLTMTRFLTVAMRLMGMHRAASLTEQLLRELLFIVFCIVLIRISDSGATVTTFSYFGATLFAAFVAAIAFRRVSVMVRAEKSVQTDVLIRDHMKANKTFVISDLGPLFLRRIDLVVAAVLLPNEQLAAFFLVSRIADVGPFLLALVASGLYDRFSNAIRTKRFRRFARLYVMQNCFVLLVYLPFLFFVCFSEMAAYILTAHQVNLIRGYWLLLVIAGASPVLIGPIANMLSMFNRRNILKWTTLVWASVHLTTVFGALLSGATSVFFAFSLLAPAIYRCILALVFAIRSAQDRVQETN